jgi:hypothetical protein
MTNRTIDLPVIEGAPCNKSGRDSFMLFDSVSDMAEAADGVATSNPSRTACKVTNDWTGSVSWRDAVTYTKRGDLARVAPSDALLSRFEHLAPARAA